MNTFLPTVQNLPEGHPLQAYYRETGLMQQILEKIYNIDLLQEFSTYVGLFEQLATIKNRLVRKEKYLLPYLEKYRWEGSSEAMRITHAILRNEIDTIQNFNAEKNIDKIAINLPYLIDGIKRLLTGEDMWLFPDALELLEEEDWKQFYENDKTSLYHLQLQNNDYTTIN